MDVMKNLKKLSNDDFESKFAENSVPDSYFISDDGDAYEIPTTGFTEYWSSQEYPDIKFRYNWKFRKIEVFKKSSNSLKFVSSSPLNVRDFLSDPEYWFKVSLDDFTQGEF